MRAREGMAARWQSVMEELITSPTAEDDTPATIGPPDIRRIREQILGDTGAADTETDGAGHGRPGAEESAGGTAVKCACYLGISTCETAERRRMEFQSRNMSTT